VDAADTEAFYRAYNASQPADRQRPLNREVLLQRATNEIALFRVLGAGSIAIQKYRLIF